MTQDTGIIDDERNPFKYDSWISQKFSFTTKRQEQTKSLLGKDRDTLLRNKNKNESTYVAFIAIRWGFAELVNGILTPTDKWNNRDLYDGFGQLK